MKVSVLGKNVITILSSNLFSNLLNIIAMTVTARYLGSEVFGSLAISQSFSSLIRVFFNSQSWQWIIKHLSDSWESYDQGRFGVIIHLGFVADVAAALLGSLCYLAIIFFWGEQIGWNKETINLAYMFVLVVLFNIESAPIGILRYMDKFKFLGIKNIVLALMKLVLVSMVTLMDRRNIEMFLVWISMDILGNIILVLGALFFLKKHHSYCFRWFGSSLYKTVWRGIRGFAGISPLHSSVKAIVREGDVLLVSILLGSGQTGLYKIAKSYGSVINKLTNPLSQVIFPELSRFVSKKEWIQFGDLIKKSVIKISLFNGLVLAAVLVMGGEVFALTAGPEFAKADKCFLLYTIAVLISSSGFVFSPAMLALGKAKELFLALLTSSFIYFICLFYMSKQWGIIGSSGAYVIFYFIWFVILAGMLKISLERNRRPT